MCDGKRFWYKRTEVGDRCCSVQDTFFCSAEAIASFEMRSAFREQARARSGRRNLSSVDELCHNAMNFEPGTITRNTSVRHVELHETLDSTSSLAAKLLPELMPLAPALVLAEKQMAGRGRGSNGWWATAGALTFTLVLNAEALPVPPRNRSMIALAAGAAVRRTVSRLVPDRRVSIKWPNDVHIASQKVGGILTEQHTTETEPAILIGIGINVNNSMGMAPAELRRNAVSIFDASGESADLNALLIDLLNALDSSIELLALSPADLCDELNQHHLLNGRDVSVMAGETVHTGICEGIDPSGALVLHDGGHRQAVIAGSVIKW